LLRVRRPPTVFTPRFACQRSCGETRRVSTCLRHLEA
jgi:hypothetical protein